MRQGCVLSPRLFSCVLEVAFKKWREQLVWTSATAVSHCWTYDLLMTFYCLLNELRITFYCLLNFRVRFFYSVVTSVVRFGAGHRKLYKSDLRKLDVHCRKLLRGVVGPPRSIDWTKPCHSILDQWNQRCRVLVKQVHA